MIATAKCLGRQRLLQQGPHVVLLRACWLLARRLMVQMTIALSLLQTPCCYFIMKPHHDWDLPCNPESSAGNQPNGSWRMLLRRPGCPGSSASDMYNCRSRCVRPYSWTMLFESLWMLDVDVHVDT